MTSYMDESFDQEPRGFFVVGGLIGRGVPLFELERKWEKLRKRSDIGIDFFKASQCEHGTGQFSKFVADPENITPQERERLRSISREFLNLLVREEYIILQGVGIVQSDFYDVIKDANAHAILGDSLYRLGYDFAFIQCAWAMKQLEMESNGKVREYISFVCDDHERYGPIAHEAYRNLKDNNPNAARYMATFDSADDKNCERLQAVDAGVYEIRRALNLAVGNWKGKLREQFKLIADTRKLFLITHTTKDQLLHLVATHKRGEPFKLDEIMEMHMEENVSFGQDLR